MKGAVGPTRQTDLGCIEAWMQRKSSRHTGMSLPSQHSLSAASIHLFSCPGDDGVLSTNASTWQSCAASVLGHGEGKADFHHHVGNQWQQRAQIHHPLLANFHHSPICPWWSLDACNKAINWLLGHEPLLSLLHRFSKESPPGSEQDHCVLKLMIHRDPFQLSNIYTLFFYPGSPAASWSVSTDPIYILAVMLSNVVLTQLPFLQEIMIR